MSFHNLALPSFSNAPSPSGLALPPQTPGPTSVPKAAGVKRKRANGPSGRARQLNNLDRELDADDDIDIERDLMAPPTAGRARRQINEDYGDEEGSEDGEEDEQEDEAVQDEDDEDGQAEAQGERRDVTTAPSVPANGNRSVKTGDAVSDRVAPGGPTGAAGAQNAVSMARRRGNRPDTKDLQDRSHKRKTDQFKLRALMDPDQAKRFDAFHAAVLPKFVIRKINKELYDQFCSQNLGAILASLSKIFIAEVTEIAKDLQPHSAHPTGPLRPYHLKLARMVLEEQKMLSRDAQSASALKPKKTIFRR